MTVTVLEKISREDLERYRLMAATVDMLANPPVTLTLTDEEIRRFYLDYYTFMGTLLEQYGIEGEEADEVKVSPYTGHIYIGTEG